VKILIMSDSHNNIETMLETVAIESPELILHLGDHDRDCAPIECEYPEIPLRSVRGNCDRSSENLDVDEFTFGGKRFFMTHGHIYGVKFGYSRVIGAASSRGADILLFGHTHIQYCANYEGLIVINPGSIGMGEKTYAILEFMNGVPTWKIKKRK